MFSLRQTTKGSLSRLVSLSGPAAPSLAPSSRLIRPLFTRTHCMPAVIEHAERKHMAALPQDGVHANRLKFAPISTSSGNPPSVCGSEWVCTKRYQGQVKGVVLDWAGTVLDSGVYAPAVVFIDVFAEQGVPISMDEARLPMGLHKKLHIRKITEIPAVRARWIEKFGGPPQEEDVERMFQSFVPKQIACLDQYSAMIPGAVETVKELQQKRKLKIGCTTGFTRAMVDVLMKAANAQGYKPDASVAADEVPQARPYPFMVWSSAIQLNVSPITAIVKVDDTADGVMEGVSAGCWSVGLAKTGNYMGMKTDELEALERDDPARYARMLARSYEILTAAGAHYVVDSITDLPPVIDDINRRLAKGETP